MGAAGVGGQGRAHGGRSGSTIQKGVLNEIAQAKAKEDEERRTIREARLKAREKVLSDKRAREANASAGANGGASAGAGADADTDADGTDKALGAGAKKAKVGPAEVASSGATGEDRPPTEGPAEAGADESEEGLGREGRAT